MGSFINLVGSMIIGGLFLLSFLKFENELQDHSYNHTKELITQQNAMEIIELLEWDFRRIGFGINFPALAVYDSSTIAYYVDFGGDGIIDTVRYSLSDTSAASGTPNPRDKIFYRQSNTEPWVDAALGVTDFKLKYFDIDGNETQNLMKIKTIEIYLELESTVPYDGEYSRFAWRERLTPPNLLPF